MSVTNPPPIRVPQEFAKDRNTSAYFNELHTFLRLLWQKAGAGSLQNTGYLLARENGVSGNGVTPETAALLAADALARAQGKTLLIEGTPLLDTQLVLEHPTSWEFAGAGSTYSDVLSAVVAVPASYLLVGESQNSPVQPGDNPDPELRAIAEGWTQDIETILGIERKLFYQHPTGTTWTNGAIIIMHGGGGSYTDFAIDQYKITFAEYSFTQLALAQGFGVFILDSSYDITDANDLWIGKIWDEEKLVRDNLDIPFLDYVINTLIPSVRPVSSIEQVFIAGHSSGGFMAVRAMSNFGYAIRGAACISSGDPYGAYRDGTIRGNRELVAGEHKDIDTDNKLEVENGSGVFPGTTTGELAWDTPPGDVKPPFRVYHSIRDGINDMSSANRLIALAIDNGYPKGAPSFLFDTGGPRSLYEHLWVRAYNQPLLNWFKRGVNDYWDYSNRTPPLISGLDVYYTSNNWTWVTVASGDAGVTGANVLRLANGTGTDFQAIGNPMYRIDGTVDDVEIVARFKARSAAIPAGIGPVGLLMTGLNGNGYTLDYTSSTTLQIRVRTGGAASSFSAPATATITAVVTDTWYCVRFRRETDGTFRAKHWAGALSAEPGAWDIETAAAADMTYTYGTSVLCGGVVGVTYDFDVAGYAINDSAPVASMSTEDADVDEGDSTPVDPDELDTTAAVVIASAGIKFHGGGIAPTFTDLWAETGLSVQAPGFQWTGSPSIFNMGRDGFVIGPEADGTAADASVVRLDSPRASNCGRHGINVSDDVASDATGFLIEHPQCYANPGAGIRLGNCSSGTIITPILTGNGDGLRMTDDATDNTIIGGDISGNTTDLDIGATALLNNLVLNAETMRSLELFAVSSPDAARYAHLEQRLNDLELLAWL